MERRLQLLAALAVSACTRPVSGPEAPERAASSPPAPVVIAATDEPDTPEPDDRVAVESDHVESAPALGCALPASPPPVRSAGGLTVPAAPARPRFEMKGRLRSHIDGPLSARGQRIWVGPTVPSFVPIASGTLELFVLDPIPNGYFALYRDPYDASSCKLSGSVNCAYEIAAFDCAGSTLFRLPLGSFLSRKDHLEVQDARLDGRVVYFNEACQSYSNQAKGKCSSLVALDPFSRGVLWRTRPLTSNNRILVYQDYIVAGYGFTAEPDFLYVVRKSDGKVLFKEDLPRAHEDLYDYRGALIVELDSDHALAYQRVGFDGPNPRLVRLTPLERTGER